MPGKSFTSIFTVLFCAAAAVAQTVMPTPSPSKIDAKANVRPAPPASAEPYDKADAAAMRAKCVSLDTESGVIELEMFPESAPESVRNFLNLTATGAFDTTTFSRVVPGFVIQGGSVWTRLGGVSQPLGGRARRTIPDEPNKVLHERGILSMARTDEPNSATTSFFILVDAAAYLDGKFAAFGRVTRGMEVVDAINKAPGTGEKPEKPVRVKKATIIECVGPQATSPRQSAPSIQQSLF
ncbi:MAG: peptidylprolyl isomerase [Pyrinomonadaceae bacterium]